MSIIVDNARRPDAVLLSFLGDNDQSNFSCVSIWMSRKRIKMDIDLGDKLKDLNKKKGVRNIFEAITKKKSTFVGHNCNLDLMFTISHLGDPLPSTLKEFITTSG